MVKGPQNHRRQGTLRAPAPGTFCEEEMKQIKRIYRLWIYGFGIAIYTHLIVLLSIVPVAIPFVIVRRMTTDQTILHRTDLVLKVVGAIVSPLVFGWLFYLLIGRRLRWHDLRTEIEK